jgi:hypothetical protein
MSDLPGRNADEERVIAEHAQLLWQQLGRPYGRDEEIWLQAEAELEVKERIRPTPILLPFKFFLLADNYKYPLQIDVRVPFTVYESRELFVQTETQAKFGVRSVPQEFPRSILHPERLPHDIRFVAMQLAGAAALIDQIARVVEHIADVGLLNSPLIVLDSGKPRLRPDVARALLSMENWLVNNPSSYEAYTSSMVRGIIDKYPLATSVVFDVKHIFLGSPADVQGSLYTKGLYGLLGALVVSGGLALNSAAPEFGSALGKAGGARIVAIESESRDNQQVLQRHYLARMAAHDVKVVQEALKMLGFDPGEADGIYGPITERAFRSFCNRYNVVYDWPNGRAAITQLARAAASHIHL